MSKRQITIKPTCMREVAAFPADLAGQLWEKINLLVTDPLPDGKLKKKLRTGDNIYRLRVGHYRVFYQFGNDWVSLLGIRRRSEDTYNALPETSGSPVLPPDSEDDLERPAGRDAGPKIHIQTQGNRTQAAICDHCRMAKDPRRAGIFTISTNKLHHR